MADGNSGGDAAARLILDDLTVLRGVPAGRRRPDRLDSPASEFDGSDDAAELERFHQGSAERQADLAFAIGQDEQGIAPGRSEETAVPAPTRSRRSRTTA